MEFGLGKIFNGYKEIEEEYEIHDAQIISNVSINNMCSLIELFLKKVVEPVFFYIELPLTIDEENSLRKKNTDPYHKAIYYLDDIKISDALDILHEYKDLFLNDGFVQFGFASHKNDDEIMINRYNIVYVLSNKINNFEPIFNRLKFKKKEKIKTAWDTFSNDSIGERRLIQSNGKTIYSIVEDLKEKGIYKYEVKEDY